MMEDSSIKLNKQKQLLTRNELNLNRERDRDRLRKADTRRKIQLGGLIVKAGYSPYPDVTSCGETLRYLKNPLHNEIYDGSQLKYIDFLFLFVY